MSILSENKVKDKKSFLKLLSFLTYKKSGNQSFPLEDIIQDKDLVKKYKFEVFKLASNKFFFLKVDKEKDGLIFYKKTYRIPEICERTIDELKLEKIDKEVIDFLIKYPMVLHTEFIRWLNTKHTSMLSYILDKYWHNFMIYSYEYESWCFDNYGYFIHHVPTPEYEKIDFKSEDFIKENIQFFLEYRKLFPITESILLYTFPYKLLQNKCSFKDIKNIIFKIASEATPKSQIKSNQEINIDKINFLIKEIKNQLKTNGYILIKNILNLNEYHYLNKKLGTTINLTNIMVKHSSERKFNSNNAMPLHTDSKDVDIISWFCQKQDKNDGKIILKSLRNYKEYFTSKELKILETINIRYPIYKRFYTGEHPLLLENSFYYAPWLELNNYTQIQKDVLSKFHNFIKQQDEIIIDIKAGDVLIIDNTSIIHGRNIIEEDSQRLLYRTHISKN